MYKSDYENAGYKMIDNPIVAVKHLKWALTA